MAFLMKEKTLKEKHLICRKLKTPLILHLLAWPALGRTMWAKLCELKRMDHIISQSG